jgi:hypothetical protein
MGHDNKQSDSRSPFRPITIIAYLIKHWDDVTKALRDGLDWLWNRILKPLGDFLIGVFKKNVELVGGAVSWLWNNCFQAFADGLQWLWDHVLKPWRTGFHTRLSLLLIQSAALSTPLKAPWTLLAEP